jgi:hypothetical protein
MLRVLLAIKGAVSQSPPVVRKFPIICLVLAKMLNEIKARFDYVLMSAVMCLAFFGCMRAGEVCVPNSTKCKVSDHLCLSDVIMDVKKRKM